MESDGLLPCVPCTSTLPDTSVVKMEVSSWYDRTPKDVPNTLTSIPSVCMINGFDALLVTSK